MLGTLRRLALALVLGIGCDGPPPPDSSVAPRSAPSPEARAQKALDAPECPSAVPPLLGRVNDLASVLTAAEEASLRELYASLERDVGSQVALLTIESLEGASIECYSLTTVEAWRLGRRGVDDGVLITVALRERQVRIEVGNGLEVVLPDELTRRIIVEVMAPGFREGNVFSALSRGSRAVVDTIASKAHLVGQRRR